MRVGDEVLYVEVPGRYVTARVKAVTGSGLSGAKVLDLITAAGRTLTHIPHVKDCFVAAGYWCVTREEIKSLTVGGSEAQVSGFRRDTVTRAEAPPEAVEDE